MSLFNNFLMIAGAYFLIAFVLFLTIFTYIYLNKREEAYENSGDKDGFTMLVGSAFILGMCFAILWPITLILIILIYGKNLYEYVEKKL